MSYFLVATLAFVLGAYLGVRAAVWVLIGWSDEDPGLRAALVRRVERG